MAHLPLSILRRQSFIHDELTASAETKKKIEEQCSDKIIKAVDLIIGSLNKKGKILLCGNGGSAADAQHIAAEFVVRLSSQIKRPGIPAIALTTDSSFLTAAANDFGFERTFARAVQALGNNGDVLIGISTSGNSENVNLAFSMAKERGLSTIGFLGGQGGKAEKLADVAILVPSDNTQRIQEGHITIGHIICSLVEQEMYG